MRRDQLDDIVLHGIMLDRSAAWLESQISRVTTEIDLVESTQPIDYAKLDILQGQLKHLYNKARFESREGEQFEERYEHYKMSGVGDLCD